MNLSTPPERSVRRPATRLRHTPERRERPTSACSFGVRRFTQEARLRLVEPERPHHARVPTTRDKATHRIPRCRSWASIPLRVASTRG